MFQSFLTKSNFLISLCPTLKDLESIVSELGPKTFFLDLELPERSSTDYSQYEARISLLPLQNGSTEKIQQGHEIPWLMPYPCSHFYFDIKFGNRLYSKREEESLVSSLLNIICRQN